MIKEEVSIKKASGNPGIGFLRGSEGLVVGSKWTMESYVMKPTAPPSSYKHEYSSYNRDGMLLETSTYL